MKNRWFSPMRRPIVLDRFLDLTRLLLMIFPSLNAFSKSIALSCCLASAAIAQSFSSPRPKIVFAWKLNSGDLVSLHPNRQHRLSHRCRLAHSWRKILRYHPCQQYLLPLGGSKRCPIPLQSEDCCKLHRTSDRVFSNHFPSLDCGRPRTEWHHHHDNRGCSDRAGDGYHSIRGRQRLCKAQSKPLKFHLTLITIPNSPIPKQ